MSSDCKPTSPPPTPPQQDVWRKTPPPEPDEAKRPPRSPSPDNCPICLDTFNDNTDRAYSDNCYHIFCFECLLEWSNNKRECPLCKKPFKAIIHKIKDHNTYEIHKVKEPEPTIPIEAFSWQSMDFHLSLQYLRQRQQLLYNRNERQRRLMRDDISRSRRSSIRRSSSTERRRYIYAYGLYCEGAQPVGGATRYRRTTPEFYRRNPACVHRLVPWLNRELVAILPHRDNVQFVLDFILGEIRRVDIRSSVFRESILPFTLRHTDHFIHEFHMFAMSPYDMASFDAYAKYPSAGRRRQPPSESAAAHAASTSAVSRSTNNVTDPPGSSSSTSDDPDINILTRVEVRRPHRLRRSERDALAYPSNSSERTRSRPERRWHVDRLREEHDGGVASNVITVSASHRRMQHRARNDAVRVAVSVAATGGAPAQRLNRERRESSLRLERSLRHLERSYPLSAPSSTVPPAVPHLLTRLHSFFGSIQNGAASGLPSLSAAPSMPLYGELLHNTSATSFQETSLVNSNGQRFQSPISPVNQRITFDSDTTSSTPASSESPRRERRDSQASSHSSDVIIVSEQKPYIARTPISLSSDTEDEKVDVESKPLSGVSRLTDTSDENNVDQREESHPAPVNKYYGDPSLTSSSEEEEHSRTEVQSDTSRPVLSEDSDCMVMFEAARPKRHLVDTPETRCDISETRCDTPETGCDTPETRCDTPETRCDTPDQPKKKKRKSDKHKDGKQHETKKSKKRSKKHSKHHKHILAGTSYYASNRGEPASPENNLQSSYNESESVGDHHTHPSLQQVDRNKSKADNSQFSPDYSLCQLSEEEDSGNKDLSDVRKEVRSYIKQKYISRAKSRFKKHHKGHKRSTS